MIASFCGHSGQAYSFERVAPNSNWARSKGILIFAASDAFGWRVVKVVSSSGSADNLKAIWGFREAQRYGAHAVFYRDVQRETFLQRELADLEAGLSPLCESKPLEMAA